MIGQISGSSSSAGRQVSSTSHGDEYSVANPSQPPVSVRLRPHSQPERPSAQVTGFGGITRDAPRNARAAAISRSSSSDGVGVHTRPTVAACT